MKIMVITIVRPLCEARPSVELAKSIPLGVERDGMRGPLTKPGHYQYVLPVDQTGVLVKVTKSKCWPFEIDAGGVVDQSG